MKRASKSNLSPKTKPPLFLKASRTSLARSNASSRKSHQPRERGTPGRRRGWEVVRETHRAKPHAQPRLGRLTAHLRHRPRVTVISARAHASQATPRPTPQSTPAGERPDRSGIGHSRVEQSAEKRRGNAGGEGVRLPRSRGHPKGASRKNDRETRRGWGARQASTGLLFQIASAHSR